MNQAIAPTQHPLHLPSLRYARFRFDVEVIQDFKLPDYAGSMLRGAFGHAFRRLSCMTRQKQCIGCPLLATCPYSQIYEYSDGQLHTNRYVIEPPESGYRWLKPGEHFSFHMVLYGPALAQLPLILLAWQQALERGLGKQNIPLKLVSVTCNQDAEPCYRPGQPIGYWQPDIAEIPPTPEQVIIRLKTPMYLTYQGKPVRKTRLSVYPMLMALARRYHMLTTNTPESTDSEIDFRRLRQLAEGIILKESVHWQEWTRYSNRQQQAMQLGGLIGEVQLSGELAPVWPLLYMGQWTHLGKHASFGLGQYELLVNSNFRKDQQTA